MKIEMRNKNNMIIPFNKTNNNIIISEIAYNMLIAYIIDV
jgi:hypothetical protein